MTKHLSYDCELRPCLCPYSDLGCVPTICAITVRSLPSHLDSNMNKHLLLSLERIKEQQTVIVQLNRRVRDLEITSESTSKGLTTLSATVYGMSLSVEVLIVEVSRKCTIIIITTLLLYYYYYYHIANINIFHLTYIYLNYYSLNLYLYLSISIYLYLVFQQKCIK